MAPGQGVASPHPPALVQALDRQGGLLIVCRAVGDIGSNIKYERPVAEPGRTTPLSGVERLTVEHATHAELRRAILTGRLEPGQRIRQDEVAAMLSVSRMPIREALRALAQEGLVVLQPHRGALVSPLTVEELEGIYAARRGLEALVGRLAAERMTAPVLDGMRAMVQRLSELADREEQDEFLRVERDYHALCYSASGRARLCHQVNDLRERAERYLRLVFDSPTRFRESLQAQEGLYRACQARDGAEAERVLVVALNWTLDYAAPLLADYLRSMRPKTAAVSGRGAA